MRRPSLALALSAVIAPLAFSVIALASVGFESRDLAKGDSDAAIATMSIQGEGWGEPPPLQELEPALGNGTCPSDLPLVFENQNWVNQGGQTRIELGQTGTSDEMSVTKFTTTSSLTYGGWVAIVPTTGNGGVSRRVWISRCPGGAPLDESLSSSSCDVRGVQPNLSWAQSEYPGYCRLETDTTYYLHYRNLNCESSSCDLYRNFRNNGEP